MSISVIYPGLTSSSSSSSSSSSTSGYRNYVMDYQVFNVISAASASLNRPTPTDAKLNENARLLYIEFDVDTDMGQYSLRSG